MPTDRNSASWILSEQAVVGWIKRALVFGRHSTSWEDPIDQLVQVVCFRSRYPDRPVVDGASERLIIMCAFATCQEIPGQNSCCVNRRTGEQGLVGLEYSSRSEVCDSGRDIAFR